MSVDNNEKHFEFYVIFYHLSRLEGNRGQYKSDPCDYYAGFMMVLTSKRVQYDTVAKINDTFLVSLKF
jgi:hypothetical protein